MRPQFESYRRLHRRSNKIAALNEAKTPEARRARKQMNDHVVKPPRQNLNGFFGTQKVRGKEKRKCRKVRNSRPMQAAIKAGY